MKAIVVTPERELELREVPTPEDTPAQHLLVQVEAAAINHGDKTFLKMPGATTGLNTSRHDIWGASAAGRVLAAGSGPAETYVGRRVAMYRSLTPSAETIGLWSERAVIPATSCLVLPEALKSADYSGSLVNVITASAFLDEALSAGHTGVVATVGGSATALALAALAKSRAIPVLFLVRSAQAAESLRSLGMEHILVTSKVGFESEIEELSAALSTTAVFDGVGGNLITRIAPHLPRNSTVWFYGFLAGAEPVAVPSSVYMARNLTMKPFSNFNSSTVRNTTKLQAVLQDLQGDIANPLFQTRIGKVFALDEIREAMAYESAPGAKAILVPR